MALGCRGALARDCVACVLGLLFSAIALEAQPIRIPGSIEGSQTVALTSAVPFQAQSAADQGAVAPYLAMNDLALLLKPSPEEQQLLDQLLAAQRDPSSPSYRRWLTPEQYADRFGLNPSDLGKIATWLQSQGFQVGYQARGRNWIAFRGTAQQVEQTFHTQIHTFLADGVTHYANTTAPAIPAALAGIVTNVAGLHDFHPKPPPHNKQPAGQGTMRPNYSSGGGAHYLAPDDFATIYDLLPLYSAGIDGTGQKLAIMGQTDVYAADIANFRAVFGLSNNPPQMVLYGTDPGYSPFGDIYESELDLEWSGAVARNATVLFVYSTDVLTSVQYAVSENLAPVISLSYSECEKNALSILDFYRSVAQQAASQGITWVTASGDSGAAGCDWGGPSFTTQGKAVDFPASIPEVTAVGGTEFNEGNGNYWNSSNGSTQASALSYIPEKAWNDSPPIWASGGGVSMYYPTPAWQTGPGFPNDGHRDVPDVSLTASADHDGFIVCWPYANCAGPSLQSFDVNGGTSASAPSFAGILALLNQYLAAVGAEATPGLGNANPQLYALFQAAPSAFHDITVGDNIVPCQVGTPDCTTGSLGYSAQSGYDQATGLGSVDAYNLITASVPSVLAIAKTHDEDFTQGQIGATYTVTVTNASASTPTSGTVTVIDAMPTGLTLVSMSGLGWTCSANVCTRSDVLNSGASYPAITVTVNVAAVDPPFQVTNHVRVWSGGLATASDVTNIIPTSPPSAPVLTSPPNGATGIAVTPQLTWSAAAEKVSYDVYFGTSTAPPWVANTAQSSYAPALVADGTTYYWQVTAKNGIGAASSPVWSFTTRKPYLITTVAGGQGGSGGDGGLAVFAQMDGPSGLVTDNDGNFYVTDFGNNVVRKIAPNGIISTVAGTGVPGYSGDGGPATSAQFYNPLGLATDASGNLYISDNWNSCIRKVDTNGIITTVAGDGTPGYSGDGGPASSAELYYPNGVAVDGAGNLYIADQYNARIRKVGTNGIITTVAGNGTNGYSGDGIPATSAELFDPTGVAVDSAGDLYIADYNNHRIRKVDTKGIITTVAGDGTWGYSGDGGLATSAELYDPSVVAVDASGNLYIADTGNNRVRAVDASGVITTLAGGSWGFSGDGGPATSAGLDHPRGLVLDSTANIYVADTDNEAIRLLTPVGTQAVLTITGTHAGNFSYRHYEAYTLTVTNAAMAGITSGTVTVTDVVPAGLTLVSMSGTGWICADNTCSRSDALAGGFSYPAITVGVIVSSDPPSQVVNEAAVSGGGAAITGTLDTTTVLLPPALSLSKWHTFTFQQGQNGATYTVSVSNSYLSVPTGGTVTVTDTIPTGLMLVSMAGTGWTCSANSCTRSDALIGEHEYPDITVTVNVTSNAPSSVTNQVSVSGGGSASANASDVTTILPAPTVTTSAATSITSTAATLPASVNPNGVGAQAWFLYSTDSSMSGAVSTPQQYIGYGTVAVPVSANISGLAADTMYYFQAVAQSSGTTVQGSILSFTTAPLAPAAFGQQGGKLVGTGAVGSAEQGSSVALSADGNTAIAGGYGDNDNAGALWVYARSGGAWTQQGSKLVGTGAVGDAWQGYSVALSADGNTAMVGGSNDNDHAGAAWVFTRTTGVWTQQGGKLVGTGWLGYSEQGASVALSADGNTALVGGLGDNHFAGAAWVFTRTAGVWTQQGGKLVGTGWLGYSEQGGSVALSADGNTAIVGGPADNNFAGAAWVFTRSGGVWTQQGSKLVGTGAANGQYGASQGFSVALSADGNTAMVGGFGDSIYAGAAWVYTRSSGVWAQQGNKLVGSGAVGDAWQGFSVALTADGNTAIVGGWYDNNQAGAVWAYTRSGGVWTQQAGKLVGTGAVGSANQGNSVALSGDGNTAIIGGSSDNGDAGAAWVFAASGTSTGNPTVVTSGEDTITSSRAALEGDVDPNGLDTQVWFLYSTNNSMSGALSTSQQDIGSGTAALPVSANITGLAANTPYYFQAVAQNSAGTVKGSILNFTTTGPPTVTTSAAIWITSSSATLGGNVNPSGSDTQVWFLYSTSSSMTGAVSTSQQDIGSGTATVAVSATPSGLAPNTLYYFQAVAQNSAGTVKGSILNFTTSLPPTVTTSAATWITSSSATLGGNVNPDGSDTQFWFLYSTNSSMTGAVSTSQQDIGSGTATVAVSATPTGLAPNTLYYFQAVAQNSAGTTQGSILSFNTTSPPSPAKIGTYNVGQWRLDLNGNGTWDDPPDLSASFGWPGATYVTGDWNGDGRTKIGVYYNGRWLLDYDGNGIWDGGVKDKQYIFGWNDPNVIPVVGDWNGDGRTKIGIYCQGFWYLDYDGNGVWDGGVNDKAYNFGWPATGVTPMVGDWSGTGTSKIGIYCYGFWYLDYDGNGIWDGGVNDKAYNFGWQATGVRPIMGDWNGDGRIKIGIYYYGFWYLDYDGNGVWDGGVNDKMYNLGWADPAVMPLVGDWSGSGTTKIGIFCDGQWYLDYNGNGAWDGAPPDKGYLFGQAGDTPIVGTW
jgi:uncharacterized repeat protein (TIGR01451 family)